MSAMSATLSTICGTATPVSFLATLRILCSGPGTCVAVTNHQLTSLFISMQILVAWGILEWRLLRLRNLDWPSRLKLAQLPSVPVL